MDTTHLTHTDLTAMPVVYRKLLAYQTYRTVTVLVGLYHLFVLTDADFDEDDWDEAMAFARKLVITTDVDYRLGDAWYDAATGFDCYRLHYLISPSN